MILSALRSPHDVGPDSIPSGGASLGRWGWLVVALLTAALTALSTYQSLCRYDALRSGWSWDLAYYNQWFWALTQGDGTITVRPLSAYAQEGPSVWKMNYLAPIRLAIVPFYWLFPDPRTLLILQNVVFWWVVPAAYGLVRSESHSEGVALSAAWLVPLTPLLWPLVWNDFRELQLVGPFVLWAIQGVRERSPRLAAVGIAGMLACRQEFALVVATFALLPPQRDESLSVTLRWRRATVLIGLCWVVFGFFGYLKTMVGRGAPDAFIDQFLGPKAPLHETLYTSGEALILGMGGWAVLAGLAPRMAILAVPWIWSLCSGRWALRFLSSTEWHHVRYAMPMAILVLAAGLVGYARLATWLRKRPRGRVWLALVWLGAVALGVVGVRDLTHRMGQIPVTIDRQEAAAIWTWIRQVDPEDAVLAGYEVAAPLSSRRWLYSYVLDPNLPPGFPQLGSQFHWLLVGNDYYLLKPLLDQGFEVVHRGNHLTIARRGTVTLARNPDFFRFRANILPR
ncbi:MAG TPA: DUF2079 domain-containing protein [Isosphaeraceae bacterium]|nr:DUF2079 domain-containing protein [Isosphaeraceae bacterium]